jgi:hypothetical protein
MYDSDKFLTILKKEQSIIIQTLLHNRDYYKIKNMSKERLTHLYGVDVSEYKPV